MSNLIILEEYMDSAAASSRAKELAIRFKESTVVQCSSSGWLVFVSQKIKDTIDLECHSVITKEVIDFSKLSKIEIFDTINGGVIFSNEAENNSIRITVLAALKEQFSLNNAYLPNSNLSNTDLSFADLSNANLQNSDLSAASLKGINLNGSRLDFAKLSNSNLSNADLCGVNLSNADLHSANLSNANLSYANLDGADLSNANLSNANLYFVNLDNVNLHEANMENVYGKDTYNPPSHVINEHVTSTIKPVNLTPKNYRIIIPANYSSSSSTGYKPISDINFKEWDYD